MLSGILLCLLPLLLGAQENFAVDHIIALKEGTLIIKLPTHTTKLNAMRELADDPEVYPERRERLKKLIAETEADAQQFNENMTMAFDSNYTFSKVLFTYDYHYDRLKAGEMEGIFLNKNLEKDPSIKIEEGPYYILRFGSSQREGSYGVDAMVVMTDQMKDLSAPFPYYQRLNDFSAFLGSIFPAPEQEKRDAIRLVGKFNKRLLRYGNNKEEAAKG